jgi:hypothetical protein
MHNPTIKLRTTQFRAVRGNFMDWKGEAIKESLAAFDRRLAFLRFFKKSSDVAQLKATAVAPRWLLYFRQPLRLMSRCGHYVGL